MFGANSAYHAEHSARATPDEEWPRELTLQAALRLGGRIQ